MRKYILLTIMLLVVTSVFSQVPGMPFRQTSNNANSMGVKIGLNVSGTYAHEYVDNETLKTGLIGGVFYEFPITNNIALRTELLYTQKGVKYVEYTGYYNYIEIPFLFSRMSSTNKTMYAGPSIGIETGSKGNYDGHSYDIEGMEPVELSIVGGMIYTINHNFFIDSRLSLGVTPIYDWGADDRNIVLSILLGYKL